VVFPRQPRRVAVLGVGAMGRRHVRVLSEMPDLYRVSGIFDREASVAEVVGKRYGVTTFDDAGACMASADLVVVASPIEAHARGATSALGLGKNVLVEKPLCASVSDAYRLVRAAQRNSSRLFVGHSERFNPVIVALRRLVRPHDVRTISIRRATPPGPPSGAREHDVLLSLGVHDVDLVSYLTRSSVSLYAASALPHGDDQDGAELSLVAASGAVTQVVLDRAAPSRERTIELVTHAEVFEGDLLCPRLVRRPRAGGPRSEVELRKVEPLVEQACAVALALEGRGRASSWGDTPGPVASGFDGARALALALEARRQLRRQCESRVSEAS
jgi:UDP-N-acetylglucosamine 3-dehydrogenase